MHAALVGSLACDSMPNMGAKIDCLPLVKRLSVHKVYQLNVSSGLLARWLVSFQGADLIPPCIAT